MESTKSNKKALIVVSIAAVLLILGGIGGTWFFMDQRIASQKTESDAQIASLRNQNTTKEVKEEPVSNNIGTQTVSFKKIDQEGRKHDILLNSTNIGEITYKGPSHMMIKEQTPDYAIISVSPDGIGGYILYGIDADVYKLDFASKKLTNLGTFAFNDISSDNRYILGTKGQKEIVIVDLSGKQLKSFLISTKYNRGGDAVFSPNSQRIAYSAAIGDPENEKSQVFVIETATGKQIYESEVVTGQKAELYWWYDNENVNAG